MGRAVARPLRSPARRRTRHRQQLILLAYPDEAYHLGRRKNQKDYQVRMKQFFDHHLKGAPAPLWMTDSRRQLGQRLQRLATTSSRLRRVRLFERDRGRPSARRSVDGFPD